MSAGAGEVVMTQACSSGLCGNCWVDENDVARCDCACHPWVTEPIDGLKTERNGYR